MSVVFKILAKTARTGFGIWADDGLSERKYKVARISNACNLVIDLANKSLKAQPSTIDIMGRQRPDMFAPGRA